MEIWHDIVYFLFGACIGVFISWLYAIHQSNVRIRLIIENSNATLDQIAKELGEYLDAEDEDDQQQPQPDEDEETNDEYPSQIYRDILEH